MHLIEDACEDYSKGIRHAVCEVIDMCWETIKDRHDGETWLGYLCNAVSEESKEELIITLAKLRVSKLQQQDVETANAKMKENNGGVYFKKK